jgi:hypothetical protein
MTMPLPEEIRKDLESVLHEHELATIERKTVDDYLALTEAMCSDHPDNDPEDFGRDSATLARNIRRLLGLGRIDAAIVVAIRLGELLAEEEYHEMWAIGRRAWSVRQNAAYATWGSPEERRELHDEICDVFLDDAVRLNSAEGTYETVAKLMNAKRPGLRRPVTARKVRRVLTGY